MPSIVDALNQIPTWIKTAAIIGATFSGGMLVQEKWAVIEQQPEALRLQQEKIVSIEKVVELLTARTTYIDALNARITYLEETVCTDQTLADAGTDRDRRCYAMTRARTTNQPPQ